MATATKKSTTKKATAKKTPSKAVAKRGGNHKYDWDLLRKQFVEGYPVKAEEPDGDRDWPNLKELSERTGTKYDRLRSVAGKERWTELRNAHQVAMAKDRQQRRQEHLGKKSIQFDEKALDVSEMGMRLVGIRMAEIIRGVSMKDAIRKQAEEDVKAGRPIDWKALSSFIRSDELASLAKAAETFQSIGMRALGTDVDRHVLEVQAQVEQVISVQDELQRDDADRLAGFAAALDRSGILQNFLALQQGEDDDEPEEDEDDIVEGELVDD